MKEKGFTLIELMIVITVIAILITIAVASFTRVQQQARDTKRKGDLRSIATALQAYYTEKTAYPASQAALSGALAPTYMPALPTPPSGTTQTTYTYTSDGASKFALCAVLETASVSANIWKVSTLNSGGYLSADAACTYE